MVVVGPLVSIKECTGSAKEGPRTTGTARTAVGTTTRRGRGKGTDRQKIKEYHQEQPKRERLRM